MHTPQDTALSFRIFLTFGYSIREMLLQPHAWSTSLYAGAQVSASPRPEPAVEVLEGCEDSDEEVEKQAPATEAAPRGARRFSEKYSSDGRVQASALRSLVAFQRPRAPVRGQRRLWRGSGSPRAT